MNLELKMSEKDLLVDNNKAHPNSLGNLHLYWFDKKTGVPRIVFGTMNKIHRNIPVFIIGVVIFIY